MYVCLCNAVTDRDIRERIDEGACSIQELQACLGVGAGCGRCKASAQEILDASTSERLALAA